MLLITAAMHGASARFSRLSVEEGLSQSSVESIAEDRFGFLWLGTQEGLNRFDGYQFTAHQASPRPGRLRDGFVRAIAPDPRGDLWIGTESGLQHLDVATGRFSESVTPPGVGVRLNTLLVERDGRLWFAGLQGGLWTRPPIAGAQARPLATNVVAPRSLVSAIAFCPGDTLCIATSDQLLSLTLDRRGTDISVVPRTVLTGTGFIRGIHLDERGKLWLGPRGRPLLRVDPRSGEVHEFPELPTHVLAIASAGKGRLWIGGRDAGLTRFDPATGETVTYRHEPGNQDSLAENDVAIVYQDRGDNLWVGAWNGGLSRLNLYAQAFRTLRGNPGQPDSLPDDDVTQMAEGADGRLWTMSRNDVLAVGDPATGAFSTIPTDRDLTSIAFAGPRLFVGTATGLAELDPATGRMLPSSNTLRETGLDRVRTDLLRGAGDALWILANGKLFHLSRDTVASVELPAGRDTTSAHAASPDRLWLANSEGFLLLAERATDGALNVRRMGSASLSLRGRLTAVTEHGGVVWVGAARGLGRFSPRDGEVTWIDTQGMPSSSAEGLIPDDAGRLWIATNRGITRFEPATSRAVHFGAVQGAQASGYVEGGATRGRSGLIYFAGKGITYFDPSNVEDNPHRPAVVFTALEILHRPVLPRWMDESSPLPTALHAAREVALGPDAVVFSVEMAAPGASDPDRLHFLHRLDGFDDDWIETTADRRVATYTRLAPGTYLLRARVRTQSGLLSAQEATLRIRILPPWWRTGAAMAAWILLAAITVGVAIAETRRRTRTRIALAEQEALRRASVTDPLTGLYNRRFLAAWLQQEVPRVMRTHHPSNGSVRVPEYLLVVMADLDNLKDINDAQGHDAGDRAIRSVAELLRAHARIEDLAVRWGGDEFLLILRNVTGDHASQVVERMRERASSLGVTLSAGFASFPFLPHDPDALSWEQSLQLADRALLQSKRRGRDAWTGFMATRNTTAAAIIEDLEAATDRAPTASIRVVEGPV